MTGAAAEAGRAGPRALWTSEEVARATGGGADGVFIADAVTFDSREVIGGELFVALSGEHMDGHQFVGSAMERGAVGCLVSKPVNVPHVRVADGQAGLEALGRAARERVDARIIGATGSVGKTGVKEALRKALGEIAPERTHASVKSYNNHTGVPLSLARMPRGSRFGIFEMGMNHAGEIAALTRQVRPHVALITTVASVHREFFPSEEAIADAKAEIFEGLEPDGAAVLPFDNQHYRRLRAKAESHARRIVTFGLKQGADVLVRRSAAVEGGTIVVAKVVDEEVGFTLKMPGSHWLSNAMAVLAAAKAAGADLTAAALGLSQLRPLGGRGAQHEIACEGGTVRLIDESYNANPTSMRAALAVLADVPTEGRRIAVLGTMGELGDTADEAHAGLAGPIEDSGADPVLLVGEGMRPLADAAGHELVADAKAAEAWLRETMRAGDTVMLKGSNSVGLARIVASLTGDTA